MTEDEKRIAQTIRDFIVRSVGEDMGAAMTLQADELTRELRPAIADVWQGGYDTRLGDEFDNGGTHDDRTENPYRE